MRFQQLLLENITSFKGKHLITFEEEMEVRDLFAITGPTGAGKSSILSAIGLALYGSHYKSTLNQADFVTLGEQEGRIELTFTQGSHHYRAEWSCRLLKDNGEPLKMPRLNRVLFQDGKALPVNKEVIEDILGLNFSQFCRTVILNQGEFSRFLSSTFTERKNILEKLYEGEQLGLLSKNLSRKIQTLKQKVEMRKDHLKGEKLYTPEDIKFWQEALSKLEGEEKELKAKLIPWENLLHALDKYGELNKQQRELIEREAELEQKLKEITPHLKKAEENLQRKERERQEAFQKFKQNSPLLQMAQDFLNRWKKVRQQKQSELNQAIQEKAQILDKLIQLKKEHELQQENFHLKSTLRAILTCRELNQEKDHCVVCDSTLSEQSSSPTETKEKLPTLKELEKEEAQVLALQSKVVQMEKHLSSHLIHIKNIKLTLQELNEEWQEKEEKLKDHKLSLTNEEEIAQKLENYKTILHQAETQEEVARAHFRRGELSYTQQGQALTSLRERLSELNKSLENISEEVQKHSRQLSLPFPQDFSDKEKRRQEWMELKDQHETKKQQLIELRTKLRESEKRLENLKVLQQELHAWEKELKRHQVLFDVLGRDEFRNFVLGQVEKMLLWQTNRELKELCQGRYKLYHAPKRQGETQDFLVVDHFRGGLPRKISTLSGGETFIVSLAMALSLAELTRGHTEIDAFFIDEGFGTLDQEGLDEVLEVLFTLQNRGKQIGLISHVEALTQRIPLNFKVLKSSAGNARVEVLYN